VETAFERHFAEGAMWLAAGDPGAAEASFAAAAEGPDAMQRPFFLKAWHGRGLALLALDRADEAVPIFAALVEARADLLDPRLQLGLALLACDRPAEALAVHEAALAQHEQHAEIGAVIADGAVALDRLGQWAEGVRWCEHALPLLEAPGPIWLNLAAFHFRLTDRSAARDALCSAMQADPKLSERAHETWAEWGDGSAL